MDILHQAQYGQALWSKTNPLPITWIFSESSTRVDKDGVSIFVTLLHAQYLSDSVKCSVESGSKLILTLKDANHVLTANFFESAQYKIGRDVSND